MSKDDFRQRTKVSKTVIDLMSDLGLLGGLRRRISCPCLIFKTRLNKMRGCSMDTYKVKKLNHPINLEIAVPGSKKYYQSCAFFSDSWKRSGAFKGVLFRRIRDIFK